MVFTDFISEIDALIRKGALREAREKIRSLPIAEIPFENRGAVAALARRAGLPTIALRLLNSIVRPSGHSVYQVNDLEKAEYAAALSYVGAVSEALTILKSVNSKECPEADLYHAFALFSQWRYAESIPILERHLKNPKIKNYAHLVGRANLAAALVHEKSPTAEKFVESLIQDAKNQQQDLVYGYSLLRLGELEVTLKRWPQAADALKKARAFFGEGESLEAFFVRKWEAFLFLMKEGPSKKVKAALSKIRNEARIRQHWETLRDCDYFLAIKTGDEKVFQHLYAGTPFVSFRKRLISNFEYSSLAIPDHYRWHLTPGPSPALLNLWEHIRANELSNRLLLLLSSDFYRPIRDGAIFAGLFPGEYFNPDVSPGRVRIAVHRLRGLLAKKHFALAINKERGHFALFSEKPFVIDVPVERPMGTKTQINVSILKQHLSDANRFGVTDVIRCFSVSRWAAIRMLRELKNQGEIKQLSTGRYTSYAFTNDKSNSK